MLHIIPQVIRDFYDQWNIQFTILLSLLLQVILILFAQFRKRTRNWMVLWIIFISHMGADWAATLAIGLISRVQQHLETEFMAFWAPFMLLHLGGSDTIATFPLEDNALWLRQLVGLVSQVVVAIIIFARFLPNNELGVSTVLIFCVGFIKYVQRTYALYHANRIRFRESLLKKPDPGPDYATFMETYASKKAANVPIDLELVPEPKNDRRAARYACNEDKLDDLAVVRYAYDLYESFKGLFVDLIFDFKERESSQKFFLKRTPKDALKVLAVELNFMYEVLYTKVSVTHSIYGQCFRVTSYIGVLAAFIKFYLVDKHGFRKTDVGISYALLFGAVGLDTVAFFMLVFSDWTVALIQEHLRDRKCIASFCRWLIPFSGCFLKFKRLNWEDDSKVKFEWLRQILFRRWSESLFTYSLLSHCLNEYSKPNQKIRNFFHHLMTYVIDWMGVRDCYDSIRYVSQKPIREELWDFIFKELKRKSEHVVDHDSAKKISSARGEWVLLKEYYKDDIITLLPYVLEVDYDESIVIWHIATDLCLNKEKEDINTEFNYIQISKILSDYMLYLLVIDPIMMSTITGISHVRVRDTFAEAKKFFNQKVGPKAGEKEGEWAAKVLIAVNTEVKPIDVKGDRSKSVLFDACILAKNLLKIEATERWMLIGKVWVELLSYAASNCRASIHAIQLSKGGEFLTFVWLLMIHLGFGDHFQISQGHARAKLVSS